MSDMTGGKAGYYELGRLSIRVLVWLFCCLLWRWCLLGFQVEDNSQEQRGAKQISQIDDAADCVGSLDLTCMKCYKRVSVAQQLHKLSPFSLHSMIEVSTEAWHATLYLITPWQYLLRLDILQGLACYFHILSCLGSMRLGLACYSYFLSCLGSICRGFCSIPYYTLAVSAEAWHSILISYHALAVSA